MVIVLRSAALAMSIAAASAKPVMTYFGIAGRGELARLYAAVGGLEIGDNIDTTGYKTKTPIGYLPALSHPEGGLFPNCTFSMGCLQESLAVERYIANLARTQAALRTPHLSGPSSIDLGSRCVCRSRLQRPHAGGARRR